MNLKRFNFSDVFSENQDGTLSPKRPISVNGIIFGSDVAFSSGVAFGGIDFHKHKSQAIAGEEDNGILIIRGFFEE